jgi:hypothetical protein
MFSLLGSDWYKHLFTKRNKVHSKDSDSMLVDAKNVVSCNGLASTLKNCN